MAWAIFHREFNWHRPNSPISFRAEASPEPQRKVRDFVEAAAAAGAATEVDGPISPKAKARKRAE